MINEISREIVYCFVAHREFFAIFHPRFIPYSERYSHSLFVSLSQASKRTRFGPPQQRTLLRLIRFFLTISRSLFPHQRYTCFIHCTCATVRIRCVVSNSLLFFLSLSSFFLHTSSLLLPVFHPLCSNNLLSIASSPLLHSWSSDVDSSQKIIVANLLSCLRL